MFLSVISKTYLRQYIKVSSTSFPLYKVIFLQVKAATRYCVTFFKKLRAKTLVLEELNKIY